MIPYASNTGTRRNLATLRDHDWRLLLTPDNATMRDGMRFGIDNGAWKTRAAEFGGPGGNFDADGFTSLIERCGCAADFVIVPDIVAGGMASLEFSLSWLPRLQHFRQLLFAVQDGMDAREVGKILREHSNVGIFLGGSTEWKLKTMYAWGMVAASWNRWYHVGRVNSAKRIRLCAEAGATSFDGTSASMYSCTVPLLDAARRQPSLLTP